MTRNNRPLTKRVRRIGVGALVTAFLCVAGFLAPTSPAAADTRPVVLTTDSSLAAATARVQAEQEPFISAWRKVLATANTDLARTFVPQQLQQHEQYYTLALSHALAARNLAVAYRIDGNVAYRDKAIEILTDWAEDANESSATPAGGGRTSAGLVVARAVVPFADTYAILFDAVNQPDRTSIENWLRANADVIEDGLDFWETGTQICDYGAPCVSVTAPWLNGQSFNNHLIAMNMGLLAIGYATRDEELVDFALGTGSNPRDLGTLIDGVILASNADTWSEDPTNTMGWPDVEPGEIFDRYRASTSYGLHYSEISLRFLTLQAEMAKNNNDEIDWYTYTGQDGAGIELAFEYYAEFLVSGNSSAGSGYYTGNGVEYGLLPLYELAHRAYPTNSTVLNVLESFDRAVYDRETFGWTTILTHGADDVAVSAASYPTRSASAWDFEDARVAWDWKVINASATAHDGVLGLTLNHLDPRLMSREQLGLPSEGYPILDFVMRNAASPGTGSLVGDYAQLFFITDDDRVWSESKSVRVRTTMDANGSYHYRADLSGVPGWSGRIYQIRFDPTHGPTSGTVDLSYIGLSAAGTEPGCESITRADIGWDWKNAVSFTRGRIELSKPAGTHNDFSMSAHGVADTTFHVFSDGRWAVRDTTAPLVGENSADILEVKICGYPL